MSAVSTASPTAIAAPVSFSEENAVVLDKWLYDVCGEEALQFPSHRRPQFTSYVERLLRVAKTKQFAGNTFDYPSRSGTREVMVLQRMLEALAASQQAVTRETEEVQERVGQVQRALEKMTMGVSSIIEEQRANTMSEAAASGKKEASSNAAGAPPAFRSPASLLTASSATHTSSDASPPQQVAHASLDCVTKSGDGGPANSQSKQADGHALDEGVSFPVASKHAAAHASVVRDVDYDTTRAVSLRYVAELQKRMHDLSEQRREREQRHARLLDDMEQLDKEYKALQTTEELVVARHQEAESCKEEELRRLIEESARYAEDEAAFAAACGACGAIPSSEPLSESGTGEPVRCTEVWIFSNDLSPPTTPGSKMSSLSPLPHSRCARSRASLGDIASTHSLHSNDSEGVVAAAPPVTASLPSETHIQCGTIKDPVGSVSNQNTCSLVSSATQPSRVSPPQREALEALRHRLSKCCAHTVSCRRTLLSEGKRHLIDFRKSQQRLKDWQDIAAQLHRIHNQLRGQVGVIHTVLSDSARRLEKGDATTQRPSYGETLGRLNTLLRERSYEALQYYIGGSGATNEDGLLDSSAEEELRALQRPTPSEFSAGSDRTPSRCASEPSSYAPTPMHSSSPGKAHRSLDHTSRLSPSPNTPARGEEDNGLTVGAIANHDVATTRGLKTPQRHRSRLELVRHLQRWESVLLMERLAILKAAHMVPGPHNGTGVNSKRVDGFSATHCFDELRALLLQPKANFAAPRV